MTFGALVRSCVAGRAQTVISDDMFAAACFTECDATSGAARVMPAAAGVVDSAACLLRCAERLPSGETRRFFFPPAAAGMPHAAV